MCSIIIPTVEGVINTGFDFGRLFERAFLPRPGGQRVFRLARPVTHFVTELTPGTPGMALVRPPFWTRNCLPRDLSGSRVVVP